MNKIDVIERNFLDDALQRSNLGMETKDRCLRTVAIFHKKIRELEHQHIMYADYFEELLQDLRTRIKNYENRKWYQFFKRL